MWIAGTVLLVIGCGAVGGLAQALTGQSVQPRIGQIGSRSGRAFIGSITAMLVVGLLSQSAFLEAVKKLFQPADTADVFQALMLVASVALAAGFVGQTLLSRVSGQLLKAFGPQFEAVSLQFDKKVAMERKIRNVDSMIVRAAIIVREGHFEVAIQLLEPILSDSEVPVPFLARAHGVIANAKKRLGLLDEAVNHVDEAHRLSPDDYRFLLNRACYRWMLSHDDAIGEVLQDLRQSIHKGLSFHEIEKDEDLVTLREHEQFRELEATAISRMGS